MTQFTTEQIGDNYLVIFEDGSKKILNKKDYDILVETSSSGDDKKQNNDKNEKDVSSVKTQKNDVQSKPDIQDKVVKNDKNKENEKVSESNTSVDSSKVKKDDNKMFSLDDLMSMINQLSSSNSMNTVQGINNLKPTLDTINSKYENQSLTLSASDEIKKMNDYVSSNVNVTLAANNTPMITSAKISSYKNKIWNIVEHLMPLRKIEPVKLYDTKKVFSLHGVINTGDSLPPNLKQAEDYITDASTGFMLASGLDDHGVLIKEIEPVISTTVLGSTIGIANTMLTPDSSVRSKTLSVAQVISHLLIGSRLIYNNMNAITKKKTQYSYTMIGQELPTNLMADDDKLLFAYYNTKYNGLLNAVQQIADTGVFDKLGKSNYHERNVINGDAIVSVYGSQIVDPVIANYSNEMLMSIVKRRQDYSFFSKIISYLSWNRARIVPDVTSWTRTLVVPPSQGEMILGYHIVALSPDVTEQHIAINKDIVNDILGDNLRLSSATEISKLASSTRTSNLDVIAMAQYAKTLNRQFLTDLLTIESSAVLFDVMPELSTKTGTLIVDQLTVLLSAPLIMKRHRHLMKGYFRYHLAKMLCDIFATKYPREHGNFIRQYGFDNNGNTVPLDSIECEKLIPSIFTNHQNYPVRSIREYLNFMINVPLSVIVIPDPPKGLPNHGNNQIYLPSEPEISEINTENTLFYSALFAHASAIFTDLRREQQQNLKEGLGRIWDSQSGLASSADSIFSFIKYQSMISPFALPSYLNMGDADTHPITYDEVNMKISERVIQRKQVTLDLTSIVSLYFGLRCPSSVVTPSGMDKSVTNTFRHYNMISAVEKFYNFIETNCRRMMNVYYVINFLDLAYSEPPVIPRGNLLDWIKFRKNNISANSAIKLLSYLNKMDGDDVGWTNGLIDIRMKAPRVSYGFDNDGNPLAVPFNCTTMLSVEDYSIFVPPTQLARIDSAIKIMGSSRYTSVSTGVTLFNQKVANYNFDTQPNLDDFDEVYLQDLIDDDCFSYQAVNNSTMVPLFSYDGQQYINDFPKLSIIIEETEDLYRLMNQNPAIRDVLSSGMHSSSFAINFPQKLIRLVVDYSPHFSDDAEEQLKSAEMILRSAINELVVYKIPIDAYSIMNSGTLTFSMARSRFIYPHDCTTVNKIVHGPMTNTTSNDITLANIIDDSVYQIHNYNNGINVDDQGNDLRFNPDYTDLTCGYLCELHPDYDFTMGMMRIE